MRPKLAAVIAVFVLGRPGDVVAQPVSPAYAEWVEGQFPPGSAFSSLSDYEDDPDRDGLVNMLEYALARNPLAADSAEVVTIESWTDPADGAAYPAITFTRRRFAAGWRIGAEVSSDLVTWRHGPDDLAPFASPTAAPLDLTERVAFRSTVNLDTAPRQFLRIRVEAPDELEARARTWVVPDTPNGLHANQNWHATGSTPDGDIYVASMDHVSDSALFRLPAGGHELLFVGDARSASEAAANWEPGETAQKFHTRPIWHAGRVFVATLDYSMIDAGYLQERGFHWYAHEVADDDFVDLSAVEPGGTAVEHGGLAALAVDPETGRLWGATIPDARLVCRDPATGFTTDFGRPPAFGSGYSYTCRFLWVDSRGRVYFTGGNPAWGQPEPVSVFGHVHFHDPAGGFGERTDWLLQSPTAIETGQWSRDRQHCFVADDAGRFYRFDDAGPDWLHLGTLAHDGRWVWVMHVSADGRSIYAVTSGATEDGLYEFDLAAGATRRLCSLVDLDPALSGRTRHTGYDAWDRNGRLFFTSFPWPADSDLLLTGVDPVRLKVALGLLPELVHVGVAAPPADEPSFIVYRSGATTVPLEVLADLTTWNDSGVSLGTLQLTLTIPAGSSVLTRGISGLDAPAGAVTSVLEIIADGRDYVVGADRRAEIR